MKKTIKTRLETLHYELEGTFDDAIKVLQNRKKEYEALKEYQSFVLENADADRYDSYEGSRLTVFGIKEETDAEYEKRLKEEDSHKENRRRQYEALKKEFEGK